MARKYAKVEEVDRRYSSKKDCGRDETVDWRLENNMTRQMSIKKITFGGMSSRKQASFPLQSRFLGEMRKMVSN